MDVIQAAGAVIWRRLSDDLIQVALIIALDMRIGHFLKARLNKENPRSPALLEKLKKRLVIKLFSVPNCARLSI